MLGKRQLVTLSGLTLAALSALLPLAARPAQARTETILYNFGGEDGALPQGNLTSHGGNLYGTTTEGGPYGGGGTVFELSPNGSGGWNETVLHSFTGQLSDGVWPYAALVRDAKGNLYGTTIGGGVWGSGTVFKVDTTSKEAVLYSFVYTGEDGTSPWAGLVHGTTFYGGAYGYGTVFKVDKTGNETVLHSFNGTPDGKYPIAGLVRDALSGNLYGTTEGGGAYNNGTVFKLTP